VRYGWRVLGLRVGHRLHFRVTHGFWCEHPDWSEGLRVDLSAWRLRTCRGCGWRQLGP
jgi:hypothetical protein